MASLRFVLTICFAVGLGTVAWGQEGRESEATEKPTPDNLLKIAEARVQQHEVRVEAIRELGKLRTEMAEVRTKQAEAELQALRAAYKASEAEYQLARNNLERIRKLAQENVVGEAELAKTQSMMVTASSGRDVARSRLEQAEASVIAVKIELQQGRLEATIQQAEATIEMLSAKEEYYRAWRDDQYRLRRQRSRTDEDAPNK